MVKAAAVQIRGILPKVIHSPSRLFSKPLRDSRLAGTSRIHFKLGALPTHAFA
jgi:hypothetical protein